MGLKIKTLLSVATLALSSTIVGVGGYAATQLTTSADVGGSFFFRADRHIQSTISYETDYASLNTNTIGYEKGGYTVEETNEATESFYKLPKLMWDKDAVASDIISISFTIKNDQAEGGSDLIATLDWEKTIAENCDFRFYTTSNDVEEEYRTPRAGITLKPQESFTVTYEWSLSSEYKDAKALLDGFTISLERAPDASKIQ